MAIVRAVKTGNWSDTTVWNTGALPTSADDVYSNTFTVTIDTSPTVLSISNAAATGVTVGGVFLPNNGITLTCTGTGVNAAGTGGPTACFDSSLTAGQSCLLVANCTGNSFYAVRNNGAGTVNITGNLTAGGTSGTAGAAVQNNSTGTINITGNCTTGAGSGANAVLNSSSGTVNITGNSTGGSSLATSVVNGSTGTIAITGAIIGLVQLGR